MILYFCDIIIILTCEMRQCMYAVHPEATWVEGWGPRVVQYLLVSYNCGRDLPVVIKYMVPLSGPLIVAENVMLICSVEDEPAAVPVVEVPLVSEVMVAVFVALIRGRVCVMVLPLEGSPQ